MNNLNKCYICGHYNRNEYCILCGNTTFKVNGKFPDSLFGKMMVMQDNYILKNVSKELIDEIINFKTKEIDDDYLNKLIYGTKGNE